MIKIFIKAMTLTNLNQLQKFRFREKKVSQIQILGEMVHVILFVQNVRKLVILDAFSQMMRNTTAL